MAPVERCIRETAALPLPTEPVGGHDGDPMRLPGGAGLTADAPHIRRGIGWGVAIKNLMYSEGFDDYSTARCRLADGVVTLKFATAEVGQGFVTIAEQIARTILGVDDVVLEPIDTAIGSAGSTSASRQTWMSGGAVDAACRTVRERLFEHVGAQWGVDPLRLVDRRRRRRRHAGRRRAGSSVAEATAGVVFDETRRVPPPSHRRPRRGRPGQLPHGVRLRRPPGRRRRRPRARAGARWCRSPPPRTSAWRSTRCRSLGQIEGGIAQGLGLAVMEEIVLSDGRIRNASFTDYLLPTFLDMPDVVATPRRGARSAGARSAPRAWASRRASRRRRRSWPPSATPSGGTSTGPRCAPDIALG